MLKVKHNFVTILLNRRAGRKYIKHPSLTAVNLGALWALGREPCCGTIHRVPRCDVLLLRGEGSPPIHAIPHSLYSKEIVGAVPDVASTSFPCGRFLWLQEYASRNNYIISDIYKKTIEYMGKFFPKYDMTGRRNRRD